ncbi:hypothetical protein BDW75DRAFT_7608 [Aspergillus navahoensis]
MLLNLPSELLRATLEYLSFEDLWTLYATSITLRTHVLAPLFKHAEITFHPVLPTVLNRKRLRTGRIFEILGLSLMHIRSVHILRCPQHGQHEVFALLGRIPILKRCLYVRSPPAPLSPLRCRLLMHSFNLPQNRMRAKLNL